MRNTVLEPEQRDIASVRGEVGAHAIEGRVDTLLERDWVEAVHEQHARHHRILDERPAHLRCEGREHAREALAVEIEHLPEHLLCFHQQSPVGVCTTFLTWPPPRYMCTPHGRHGSNERTARMMSMPLKLSGPFSSKIGVFCTASSYGPGVP